MKKSEMIDAIANATGLTRADTEKAFNGVFELLKDELVEGNKVQIAGFGTFRISSRAARDGRNPQTGEAIRIKASKSVSFKSGSELKKLMNK